MNELIKITEQDGQQVVSARELHTFLESKRKFTDWMRTRIDNYELVENKDYAVFHTDVINSDNQGGRPSVDYALALDCAKELSMVEGNDKGKQARRYFIECEKKLKEAVQPMSELEMILKSAQILLEQKKRLHDIETRVANIEQSKRDSQKLLEFELSTTTLPEKSLRTKCRQAINEYCGKTCIDFSEAWKYAYKELYYTYKFSVNARKRPDESSIDCIERCNQLENLWTIVSTLQNGV